MTNVQWVLTSRPAGLAGREHFEVRESEIPAPGPGQVLVRNIYLLVPASMRLWMNEKDSYFPAQPLGAVMMGITLGVVERSESDALPVGTYVNGLGGWQQYYVSPAAHLRPVLVQPDIPLPVSFLDVQGLTAYVGVVDVAAARPGETMVVTAAAGSAGSLAAQIGKVQGLRVIGVAGGPEKCTMLIEEFGLDGAIDYKSSDVDARLTELCPDGVDILFENVGGPIMNTVIEHLNLNSRIALCGLVSGYTGADSAMPVTTLMELVNRRVRMEGFIVLDHLPRLPEIVPILDQWVREGVLDYRYEIVDGGLDRATEAMGRLARGENAGMQLVRISPESR